MQPDAFDIGQVVNAFKKAATAPPRPVSKIQPNLVEINLDVDAADIGQVVDGAKQSAYPFPGPCICPSVVTCGATACTGAKLDNPGCIALYGASATCYKECLGGAHDGQPCLDNNPLHGQCPGGTCSAGGFCRDRCGRCSP